MWYAERQRKIPFWKLKKKNRMGEKVQKERERQRAKKERDEQQARMKEARQRGRLTLTVESRAKTIDDTLKLRKAKPVFPYAIPLLVSV